MGGSALPICELWPGPRVPCVARLPASPARGPVARSAYGYVNVSPSACACSQTLHAYHCRGSRARPLPRPAANVPSSLPIVNPAGRRGAPGRDATLKLSPSKGRDASREMSPTTELTPLASSRAARGLPARAAAPKRPLLLERVEDVATVVARSGCDGTQSPSSGR